LIDKNLAVERIGIDARVEHLKLLAEKDSTLACLDSIVDKAAEMSCEKMLFAAPAALIRAVAFVSAQLSLLSDATDFAQRGGTGFDAVISRLRRVAEVDRYGIVAQLLVESYGCSAKSCAIFALFRDPRRVITNITEKTYDHYVARYLVNLPESVIPPVADNPNSRPQEREATPSNPNSSNVDTRTVGAAAGEAKRVTTSSVSKMPRRNLFLPSSESIPRINIMTPEPVLMQARAPAGPKQTHSAAPGRPLDINAAPR